MYKEIKVREVDNCNLLVKNQTWLELDGDWSSYVNAGLIEDFGSNLENTNVTVSFWINYTNVSEVWIPFGTQSDYSSISAYLNGNVSISDPFFSAGTVNHITFNLRDTFGQELRKSTHGHMNISDGFWHHITLTARPISEDIEIYIDGEKQPIDSVAIYKNKKRKDYNFHDFENFLAVGAGNKGTIEQTVPGNIDEFRIYDISLNEGEVKKLFLSGMYRNNKPLDNFKDDNLILYYSFNEGSGNITYDNTKFERNGQIFNATFRDDGINITLIEGFDYLREKNKFFIKNDKYKWRNIEVLGC